MNILQVPVTTEELVKLGKHKYDKYCKGCEKVTTFLLHGINPEGEVIGHLCDCRYFWCIECHKPDLNLRECCR